MSTPSSTARTRPGECPASGASMSVAGRLLSRFAASAASAAAASRPGRSARGGTSAETAVPTGPARTASTTIPSANTKPQNAGLAARSRRAGRVRWRSASTSAPAPATHAGCTPSGSARPNPASVRPSTPSANRGTGGVPGGGVGCTGVPRSPAKYHRKTAYSVPTTASHGSAISAVNRVKPRPLYPNASRLVRLDTGSSSEAELARCPHAYRCGRARTPAVAAVASTTGVSRTTVASRLSTAVTAEARTNTTASSRRGEPRATRAASVPAYPNTFSSPARYPSTSTAARKPTVGSSATSARPASRHGTSPATTTTTAPGAAAVTSGSPRGRTTAKPSTPSSTTMPRMALTPVPARQPCYPERPTVNRVTVRARWRRTGSGRRTVRGRDRRWRADRCEERAMADTTAGNLPVPVTAFGPLVTLGLRVHDLQNTGRYAEALAAADAYEALAAAVGDEKTISLLLQGRMYVYQQQERFELALEVGHELLRRRRAEGQPIEQAKTLADMAWTLVVSGQMAAGMRYLARSSMLLDRAQSRGSRYLSALASYSTTALTAELYEEADAGYERVLRASEAPHRLNVTNPYEVVRMEVLLRWGMRLHHIGEYGPAVTRLRRVLALAEPWLDAYPHEDGMRMGVAAYRALALAALDECDEAIAAAAPLVPSLRALGMNDGARMAHLAYGIALRTRGDLDAAERELLAAHQLVTPDTEADQRLFVAHERTVLAVTGVGDRRARVVLDALLEHSRQLWQRRLYRLAMLRQAIEHETLEAEHARVESALMRDPLTGLGNRLSFDHVIAGIDAGLRPEPTCLLVIDVDYFKA